MMGGILVILVDHHAPHIFRLNVSPWRIVDILRPMNPSNHKNNSKNKIVTIHIIHDIYFFVNFRCSV